MNRCRALGNLAVILTGLTGAVLAVAATGPAALASTSPRRIRLLSWVDPPRPPDWHQRPRQPNPARAHAALAGAIPAWQLTLMAVTIVLLVATLVAIANPGPGRSRADQRNHRRTEDRIGGGTDPQGQPAALARSTPPSQDQCAGGPRSDVEPPGPFGEVRGRRRRPG